MSTMIISPECTLNLGPLLLLSTSQMPSIGSCCFHINLRHHGKSTAANELKRWVYDIWKLVLFAAMIRSITEGRFLEAAVCALQDAPTSTEQEIDYGSKQANEAVKQLQQLGAIVYPPAEKKDVDWGLLAGFVFH